MKTSTVLAAITLFSLFISPQIFAAFGTASGSLNWSCTAGGSTCVCEGGKNSLDCKDMVSVHDSVCLELTPTPSDTLTCDVHGRCSCVSARVAPDGKRPTIRDRAVSGNLRAKKPITATKPGISAPNMQARKVQRHSVSTQLARISGSGGLNWSCTSGSTTCTCSGGENSDDCGDLRGRMCGLNDLSCNSVGTCSCTRGKAGGSTRPGVIPGTRKPTKMSPLKPAPSTPKHKRVFKNSNQLSQNPRYLSAPKNTRCKRENQNKLLCLIKGKKYLCNSKKEKCFLAN